MAKICLHCKGSVSVDLSSFDIDSTEAKSHPNVLPFSGVLLRVDEPSDAPPHGSEGHLIYVPIDVASGKLHSLIGMGINYQSDLEGHDPKKKIGIITKAWISGQNVKVAGIIWKKDFPEAVRVFRKNRGQLGMSMELGDVYVREKDESVWHLADFHFTGATVLLKESAAYHQTSLAASKFYVSALAAAKAAMGTYQRGGKQSMSDKKKTSSGEGSGKVLVAAFAAAVAQTLGEPMKKLAEAVNASTAKSAEVLKVVSIGHKSLERSIQAAMASRLELVSDDTDDVAAAGDPSNASDPSQMAAGDPSNASDPSSMNSARRDDASDPSGDASDPSGDPSDTSDAEAAVDASNTDASDIEELGKDFSPGAQNPNSEKRQKSQARSGAGDRIHKTGTRKSQPVVASAEVIARINAAGRQIVSLKAENDKLKKTNSGLQSKIKGIEAQLERFAEQTERKSVSPEVTMLLEKQGYDVRELMGSRQKLSVAEVDNAFAQSGIQLDPAQRMAFKNQLLQANLMEDGAIRRTY